MASDSAWALGASIGREQARRRTEHKQEMADAQFQERHNEIQGMIDNLTTRVSSIQDKNSPDYLKAKDELANALQMRDAHWGADKHPSKLMELARGLGRDLHFPVKAKPAPVAPPVYGQPTMEINGEKVPTGAAYKVEGPQTPAQISSQKEADMLLSAGPLTPAEQEPIKAAQSLAAIQSAVKNFDTLYPHSSPEERTSFLNDLVQQTYGATGSGNWTPLSGKINGQPTTLWFDKKTRQVRTMSGGPVAPEVLDEFVPDQKTTEAGSKRADFDAFVKNYKLTHNGQDYPGTFESWTAEQSAIGRTSIPKPQTADQQEQAILKKQAMGQQLTPEEIASLKAYKEWIRIKTTDPKVAGYQALAWSRIQQVEVPGSPGETTYVPAGIAFKNQMHGPSSLSHLMTIYYGTGKGGQDLLRFNTATHHLQLMAKLGDALNNGNIQAVNRFSNEWKTQFLGEAAPTNFNAIRSAVAGELEKLYTQVGATQQGLADMKADVNNMQSPDQLNGYIDTALATMRGKIEASGEQYAMGVQGQPAFPSDIIAPPSAPPNPQSPSSPTVTPKRYISVKAARARFPEYQKMTDAQIQQALKAEGFTPEP